MASLFTHAFVAASIGTHFVRRPGRGRILAIGALCSVLPDADVVGFRLGVPYGDVLGHRGLSHSIVFALALSILASLLTRSLYRWPDRFRIALFFLVATLSHGVLDAMTDGGLGVAFFAPFASDRFFFPWRPIVVSPIGIREFFGPWGLAVVKSELIYIWIPAAAVGIVGILLDRRRGKRALPGHEPKRSGRF
jgi:inner membrane protein